MTEDFVLSNKAIKDLSNNPIPNYYFEKDVKEFIRLLKNKTFTPNNRSKEYIDMFELINIIDKLAGEKLVEK